MRYFKFIAAIFLITIAFGCQKVKPVPADFQNLVGEYEWSYSTNGDIKNASDSGSRYGVRIDEKGYLFTYIDGKKQEKYKISNYFQLHNFQTHSKSKISISGRLEEFEGGQKELIISNFPNETNHVANYFLAYD